jgi:siroheme synthase/SAM-dependent methyltransferase
MNTPSPTVTLLGAGPGDPELLTVKAVKALRRATVALVDDLVDPGVLRYLKRSARIIPVGKRGGCASTPQAFIHKLMVAEALKGEQVVRIKGGDPFRLRPRWRGVPTRCVPPASTVEVVNGLTAGIAGPAAIGVPVTDRRHAPAWPWSPATRRTVATAPTGRRWRAAGLTLVVYMGVARVGAIVAGLREGGLPAHAGGRDQRRAHAAPAPRLTTLADLVATVQRRAAAPARCSRCWWWGATCGATPQDFVRKWAPGGPAHALNERAGAQAHFIDLCRVLDVPEPGDAERYCFERGVRQTGSLAQRTDGFADVWLRGHFAWEYKAPGKSLEGALRQLMMYALPLESPPLLVVSDRLHIRVHTHFTGTPSECHAFALDDLLRADARARLRRLWTEPEAFRPARSNRDITEEAARTFAATAERLRAAGTPAGQVSHFLTQCVFSFFAEDVGLLPARLFERLVGVPVAPAVLRQQLAKLFEAMRDGGLFGVDAVPWFNGGLFATIAVPPLADADVAALKAASALDWSAIDPSIFGTLFERGLDPAKRSQLGAHYTDPATIQRLVQPVVQRPLLDDWAQVRQRLQPLLARSKRHGDKAWRDAQAAFVGTLERLKAYRVLDPACGSGNFLYLALKCLKDVEHQINLEAEQLGLERQLDGTGPHNVLGIELNEYAAELARVTVWIGELQWRIQQGYGFKTQPVLEALDHIECRDAVLNADGTEAAWPVADAVVGNPPFVGDKKMRGELGDVYTEALRAAYKGRVPGGADLVCYWFERARAEIEAGRLQRAGLVSARADDTTFGLLHSRFHELWSLRLGTSLEDRPPLHPHHLLRDLPLPRRPHPADTAHQRTESLPGGALIPADLRADVRAHAEAIAPPPTA